MGTSGLTYDRLQEVIHYGPITGAFTWKETRNRGAVAGQIAGGESRGYLYIAIDGVRYLAHRLAWFYIHGYLSENQIDHINRIKNDNRLCNLREVSQSCNMRNTSLLSNNNSGMKGVNWHRQQKKWRAFIKVNGRSIHLGVYDEFDDAVCARLAGEQCLHWDGCDSSSSAYIYVKNMIGKEC